MDKQNTGAGYLFSFKKHMVKEKYLYQFRQYLRGHAVIHQLSVYSKRKAVGSRGTDKMAILMLSSAFYACLPLEASKLNTQGRGITYDIYSLNHKGGKGVTNLPGADLNVTGDGPPGQGPWMGRVIRSQHINSLKYDEYKSVTDIP